MNEVTNSTFCFYKYDNYLPLLITTKSKKLSKQQRIDTAYKLLLKNTPLVEIAKVLELKPQTVTKLLKINWNTINARPETLYLQEETWACVCFLLEKTYSLKQLSTRLNACYGEILTYKLVQSIKYYYKKMNKKDYKYNHQLCFYFLNLN